MGETAKAGGALPLPAGMSLTKSDVNNQLQLGSNDSFARRMRRLFGYFGAIKLFLLLTEPAFSNYGNWPVE